MVQLTPSSPTGDGECQREKHLSGCQLSPSPVPTSISSTASPLQAYETYLENGYVSLKHKIRNIEKKKVKLEDYRERRNNGEPLNQDQLEAVEKYEEVIHNLEFAKELQKTFSALSQDLLKAQKKALRRDHLLRVEADKKRLRTILQMQYMFQSFGQDHVQKDFKDGQNGAMYISPKELEYLVRFSKLACPKRYKHMSLEDQMEQSTVYFWNLLEGSEKIVAGTNYKNLKELSAKLLDCGYFENVPEPHCEKPKAKGSLQDLMKSNTPEKVKMDKTVEPEPFVEHVKSDIQPNKIPASRSLLKAEAVKLEAHRPVENKPTKPEVLKPWGVTADVKLQEQTKWQVHHTLTVISKPWQAANFQAALPAAKISEPEPKEKRERVSKLPVEIKQMSSPKDLKVPLTNGQNSIKKREVLPSEGDQLAGTVQVHRILPQSDAEFCSSPTLPKDPELRKQKLEDLIDQIKGTYNFMQDSMLDFDLSPRVSSSPRCLENLPVVPVELKVQNKMEPILSPAKASSVLLESEDESILTCHTHSEPESMDPITLTPQPANRIASLKTNMLQLASIAIDEEKSYSPEPVFVSNTTIAEPLPERSQAHLTLLCEQPPSPKTPTNTSVLQLKKEDATISPPSNVSLPMSSSPFQGMQAVFKVNAPLPPRKEPEFNDDPPYSPGYHQTFTTASTQTLPHSQTELSTEQNPMNQEHLSGSPYHLDESTQLNGSLSCYTPQNLLPRMPQPYMSSRGSIRGTNRGRVMTNGYRCPNGYKGPETFRGIQTITNGGYAHVQCPVREYPVVQFTPRDANSHLCQKRGTLTSNIRTSSRAWNESSQVCSPERQCMAATGDSGHGDPRNMNSVDMSMTNQATTILPVHVYPLPQQMRVAFSAARTSNFAPGSLDQPIVFDLLLNNLGDTFDFQVGRFMCPVNGTYVFIFHMLKLAVNVPLYVNLMKNEEVLVSAYANDGAPDHETASNHAVLQLFQGDQIWLRLHRGAIYGSSWKYSTFSGYLLYQD